MASSIRCCRCSSSTSYRSHRSRMSRALAPRCPVSSLLTFDGLTMRRSATCSAVQPFWTLSVLSSVPSSRRLTVGLLPVVGIPAMPPSAGTRCNTSGQRDGNCSRQIELALANGTCQGDYGSRHRQRPQHPFPAAGEWRPSRLWPSGLEQARHDGGAVGRFRLQSYVSGVRYAQRRDIRETGGPRRSRSLVKMALATAAQGLL
jgi:hypothetical protein